MTQKTLVWDLPVRAFHWLLAASFAGAWLLAESERWRDVHVMLGYTTLGLVAFRLLWGFAGSRYARFRSFLFRPAEAVSYLRELVRGDGRRHLGHNPAGSYSIWAILALAVLTGASGWAVYAQAGGEAAEEVHEFLSNAWLAVVGLHVGGVLLSSLFHRENLVASMVTGYKEAAAGTPAARPGRLVGALVVAGVVGFWSWSLAGGGATTGVAGGADGPPAATLHRDDD